MMPRFVYRPLVSRIVVAASGRRAVGGPHPVDPSMQPPEALIAGFLFPMLGIALALGGGLLGAIILAFIGAVILLVIVKVIKQITA